MTSLMSPIRKECLEYHETFVQNARSLNLDQANPELKDCMEKRIKEIDALIEKIKSGELLDETCEHLLKRHQNGVQFGAQKTKRFIDKYTQREKIDELKSQGKGKGDPEYDAAFEFTDQKMEKLFENDAPTFIEKIEKVSKKMLTECGWCKKTALDEGIPFLKQCPCKTVRYCNSECQKSDWSNHKKSCSAKKQS